MLEQALQAGNQAVAAPVVQPIALQGLASPVSSGAPVDEHGHAHDAPMAEGVSEAAFNSALQKLIAASGGKVSITSGKRSRKRQEELWAQALEKYGDPEIADNWVARPGGSKHETGLAADLKFADDATKAWVHANAEKFGLYFPMEWEPWHIEIKGSRG